MPSSRQESQNFKYQFIVFLLLYFVQGMPFGLQTRFLPIFFRIHGMSLTNVSLYKLLLIPWVLKAFWAPLVDNYGNKKAWLMLSMLCLGALCVAAALVPPAYAIQLAIIMFLFNLITSIQDIALDSLVIEKLTPEQLVKGNIAQVVGYKIGSLFSGGIFALFTETVSWAGIFYGLALIYFAGTFLCATFISQSNESLSSSEASLLRGRGLHSSLPGMEDTNSAPHVPTTVGLTGGFSCYFWKIFKTEGTVWMLFFVVFYKIGEQGILNMFPMYLLDNNISPQTVGFWTGFIGQAVSVLGSITGGLILHEFVFTSLKFHLVLRGTAAFIMWLSVSVWNTFNSLAYVCSIISLLLVFFSGGAITTITYTLVMHLSKRTPQSCRVSHYTTLTTGDILGRILFSAAVGSLAQWTSYLFVFSLFAILSLLAVIAMSLAPTAIQHI